LPPRRLQLRRRRRIHRVHQLLRDKCHHHR
jgi:hypothetical protein